MSENSKIEWTDTTWNPIVGCSRVSEGCRNCYAEKFTHRFAGPGQRWEGLTQKTSSGVRWTGKIMFDEKALVKPLSWAKPRRVFVNSMSDLFHENVPDEWIYKVFAVMQASPQHTFQVLTKRPGRMVEFLNDSNNLSEIQAACDELLNAWGAYDDRKWPLDNVWLGTSVENQEAADSRIPWLIQTPAAVRFLSCEPLLGPVDLMNVRLSSFIKYDVLHGYEARLISPGTYEHKPMSSHLKKIDWVIAGGESGHGARPMHPDWVRTIRDHCKMADVPFFFKQWGEHQDGSMGGPHPKNVCVLKDGDYFPYIEDLVIAKAHDLGGSDKWNAQNPTVMSKVGKGKSGRDLDGETWDEMPKGIKQTA